MESTSQTRTERTARLCAEVALFMRDHVLSRVGTRDGRRLEAMVQLGADAVETILADGVDEAMTRFNGVDLDADGQDVG